MEKIREVFEFSLNNEDAKFEERLAYIFKAQMLVEEIFGKLRKDPVPNSEGFVDATEGIIYLHIMADRLDVDLTATQYLALNQIYYLSTKYRRESMLALDNVMTFTEYTDMYRRKFNSVVNDYAHWGISILEPLRVLPTQN